MSGNRIPDATAVNAEHRAFEESSRQARGHAIACGRLLREVKAAVGHGGFTAWVDKHCEFSVRSARDYMRAADHLSNRQRAADFPETSLRAVLQDAREQEADGRRADSRAANRALVKAAPIRDSLGALIERERRFPCIVVDPPWPQYEDAQGRGVYGRSVPYVTKSVDDIRALPVAALAADNAHLYLWTTNHDLPAAYSLVEAWGFRQAALLTWGKTRFGVGQYFRGQTEHAVFGVKGSQPLLRRDMGNWFTWPSGRLHSAKPAGFYEMVESCSPGPWLEIFGRGEREGWVVTGAEAEAAVA
jgi:N6-adenosine-specific RNA methylase IME4